MNILSERDINKYSYTAYNYMANYLKNRTYKSIEEYLYNTEKISIPLKPILYEGSYKIETNEIISIIFKFVYKKYLIRIKNNLVDSFWKFNINKKNKFPLMTYDINTLEPLEGYLYKENKEIKYCLKTNDLLQINYGCSYNELPNEIKNKLDNFEYKNKIFAYGHKPYGTIVYFYY